MPHYQCAHCELWFRSLRGRTQHIDRTPECSAAQAACVGVGGASTSGANLRSAARAQAEREGPGSPDAEVRRETKRSRRVNFPDDEEELPNAEADQGNESASSPDSEGGSPPFPDVNDDSALEDESEDSDEPPNGEANTQMLEDFREYCATHDRKFEALDAPTVKSIKLMDILRTTKAPLNAYQPFLEWHLRETGELRDDTMTLKDSPCYFSRQTLMKRLFKRYNCEALAPKIRKVRLPFSKSVASIPVREAKDVIVSLLTDPRVKQDDYLFFDDNPLAPPPHPIVYLEDLNTGDAFLKSHERMIKEKGEVLLPVPMYIDGAVTGQFSDLPITALKVALGIHTREYRDKEFAWRELGWVPQVRQQKARGKKLFQESGHLEAQELVFMDGEGEAADEDEEASNEEGEDEDEESSVKAQDFHTILSTILESFVELQRTGFIWDLVYKGKLYKNIKFVIFVPFVKCDTEEADTLCGKYRVRTRNIKQICRYCHCPTSMADDPRHNHKMKTQPEIQKLIDQGRQHKLQELSQHNIRNAFYEVTFHAANHRGIHGACPSEMLHAILLGIFKYCRESFFSQLGPTSKLAEDINGLAKMYGSLMTRQSDRSLPNTNFSKGIQKGKLMAKEYRGVLLVMAAVVVSTEGRKLMSRKKKIGGKEGVTDWSRLLELLLEWEAFLNLKKIKKSDAKKLKQKHVFIMYMLRNVARRYEGMGLKIMKFHAILHLVEDMLLFGTPSETDTGSNESHHKPSKYAARLTQRKEATFNLQTAQRMTEFLVLDHALSEIEGGKCLWEYFGRHMDAINEVDAAQCDFVTYDEVDRLDDWEDTDDSDDSDDPIPAFRNLKLPEKDDSDSDSDSEASDGEVSVEIWEAHASQSEAADGEAEADETEVFTGGTKIGVFEDPENGEPSFSVLSRSKRLKDETTWGLEILTFLIDLQEQVRCHLPSGKLPVLTLHKRGKHIFHGHPNYRCLGPWRDWALFDWGAEGSLPCHIWCFVSLENMPTGRDRLEFGGIWLQDGVYAVVESAEYTNLDLEEGSDRMTDIFTPLSLIVQEGLDDTPNRKFYLADTEALVGPCIVIPDIGGDPNEYFQVKPRTEWAQEFLCWLRRPHQDDAMDWTDAEDE